MCEHVFVAVDGLTSNIYTRLKVWFCRRNSQMASDAQRADTQERKDAISAERSFAVREIRNTPTADERGVAQSPPAQLRRQRDRRAARQSGVHRAGRVTGRCTEVVVGSEIAISTATESW